MAGELTEMAAKILAETPDVPFQMVGLDHVVILVGDMEKAMHFYTQVLGCRPGYSYPQLAMEQVFAGSELLVLIDISKPEAEYAIPEVKGGRNVDHICINIQHCPREQLREHFAKHGVEIEREAIHGGARGMGEATYVLDPWGFRIELKGPPLI